jgi:predicted dehydrogenase
MHAEPDVVSARHDLNASGADRATSASLRFPGGTQATLTTDMTAEFAASIVAEGRAGTMHIANPLLAALPQSLTLTVGGTTVVEHFPNRASFAYQLEAFRDAVIHGMPVPTRGEDSLATIRLLAAIRAAAESAKT